MQGLHNATRTSLSRLQRHQGTSHTQASPSPSLHAPSTHAAHAAQCKKRLAWKRSGEGCASHHCFSSWWALTTMQPRTPGTANSSTSFPLSPHTITPSFGSLPASLICIDLHCSLSSATPGATPHAGTVFMVPSVHFRPLLSHCYRIWFAALHQANFLALRCSTCLHPRLAWGD